ncbi:MAG: DUF1572 family protein [Planctomycetaceae bacterium]
MREVIPSLLWIGNAADVRSKADTLRHEIAATIDLAIDETPATWPHDIIHCRLPLIDGTGNSPALLRAAVEITANFVSAGVRTLVTCGGGMSRSVAVSAAVVARLESTRLNDALQKVAATGAHDVAPGLWADMTAVFEQSPPDTERSFLLATVDTFKANRRLAERAVEQTSDQHLHIAVDDNTNSIAVIMKHVAGNLISRWTDFLTSDGEKPDRNRDDEFVDSFRDRAELLSYWNRGWTVLLDSLNGLTPEDLHKTVVIRGEPHSVSLAIQRSLGHTCYHAGQIVQLARVHAGDNWNVLTIARGQSEQFNRDHWGPTGRS